MSRLDELIRELCPDGVEYKAIPEIFTMRNGYTPSKSKPEYWENGTVPWFRMEDIRENGNILAYASQYVTTEAVKGNLFPADSIIIATSATIGVHALITVPSLANQRFTYLMLKDEYREKFNIRFIYYYCYKLDEFCKANLNQGNFASVDMKKFAKFKFPVPPLPVQEEIVRILDTFTALTAELQAELQARRKQYEYYKNEVFSSYNYETVNLASVLFSIHTGLNPRKFFKLNTDDADNYYVTIREFKGGQLHFDEKTDRINDAAMALCNNRSNLEVGDVLFSGTGTIGEMYVIEEAPLNWNIKEGVYALKPDTKKILPKYLKYFLSTKKMRERYDMLSEGGTVKSISMKKMDAMEIMLPSLEDQKQIIEVLDRFDTLCNDLTVGLPAEIAARQKQYEYYRDKLLTFKPLA